MDAGIRHIEFLDSEVAAVERLIAQQALSWPEIRRLMTVPGVNLVCAASFIAAVGDTRRFMTSRKLVAYLGLDPKVKQSGEAPARSGRISKRGSASARWALVEAAWTAVNQPGPLHAFYQRTKARRGHGKAIVATARKLAVLFWCMLTRSQDYAHQQPSLTRKKLRRLEITAPPNSRVHQRAPPIDSPSKRETYKRKKSIGSRQTNTPDSREPAGRSGSKYRQTRRCVPEPSSSRRRSKRLLLFDQTGIATVGLSQAGSGSEFSQAKRSTAATTSVRASSRLGGSPR